MTDQPTSLQRANRAILHAALSVAAASLIVKLIAFGKEIAVAAVFGRSDAMDAFLAALLIPSLLVNLIAESMNQALVPTLVRVREREGLQSAQRLLSSSLLWLVVLLVAVSLLIVLIAPALVPLVGSNFDAQKRALTLRLFCALVPLVLLSGIASNCTAVLNSLDRFLTPTLAPAVISLTVFATLALWGARLGIWVMIYATLAGTLFQTLIVAFLLTRHGYRFSLRWHGATGAVREVGQQYGPIFFSGLVASSGLIVDQAMAAGLTPGSISALVYANRFVAVALTLMAGAISTAVVPSFSRMVAQNDWTGCRSSVNHWVRVTLAISVPVAAALIFGARWLVSRSLEHGAFGPSDTRVVTAVLAMYALQIPFYVASRVDYRLIVAARRTDLILLCGLINLALDIVLNLLLMRTLGVAGIALATSLWVLSTFLFLRYWSLRLIARNEIRHTADALSLPPGKQRP